MTSHVDGPASPAQSRSRFFGLMLGSLGVVFGDIGTSPIYALREALVHAADNGLDHEEVVGIVSLLLWALTLIVTVKYVLLVLRADNHGEGGTLSLLALAQEALGRRTTLLFILGVIGAALFYGDAVITPAISVLSAVEGLKLVAPSLGTMVLPLTVAILVLLFAIQSRGTESVSRWFGPITLVWFLALAGLGLMNLLPRLSVLEALNPVHAVSFVAGHGLVSLAVMGSVFLAVTGAEALYADMGHFGSGPIRVAWGSFVFPALALNYLGQGALVLERPDALDNPFFLMAPGWAVLPLVILATLATIIASQAVISGAYSLTQQAIQLGLLPRLEIRHTSESLRGQIYMPKVNWYLLAIVLLLVVLFGSSSALANAYGIAVTGTMVATSLLAYFVLWRSWKWPRLVSAAVIGPLLLLELVFLGANLTKVLEGGWMPLVLGVVVGALMVIWVRGTKLVFNKSRASSIGIFELVRMLERSKPLDTSGTAVFLTSDADIAPAALMHNLKHNHVLHERNLVLTVRVTNDPRVPEDERLSVESLGERFTRVSVRFGYMEEPNIPKAMAQMRKFGVKFDIMSTSFFLSRRSFRAVASAGMPLWQDRVYIALTKAATDATDYYRIPSGRVVELGQQFTV